MPNISPNALRAGIELGIDNLPEALEQLAYANDQIAAFNAKTSAIKSDDIDMRRMAFEGKYDADIQLEYELRKLINLEKELGLSVKATNAALDEMNEKYVAAKAGPGIFSHEKQLPGREEAELHKKQLAEEIKVEEQRVTRLAKASKEVENIRETELTHKQKWAIEEDRIRKLKLEGLSDSDADVLRKRNKQIHDEEEARLQEMSDAEDRYITKREEALKKANKAKYDAFMQSGLDAKVRMTRQQDKEAADAEAKAVAENAAALKASNVERQKALALLNTTRSATQQVQIAIQQLNAAHASDTINAAEHAEGIENLNARMRSMQGGAGNMGYVVGNLMTGLEDFTTVISMTGFGMDGFAAATRSASNNIGQAIRGIGTAASAIYAPLVSIGAVLIGFAIPAIYRWVTGAEDATKATQKWADELERLKRILGYVASIEMNEFQTRKRVSAVDDITDSKDAADKIKNNIIDSEETAIKIKNMIADIEAAKLNMSRNLLPQKLEDDLNKIGKELDDAATKMFPDNPKGGISALLKDEYKKIQEEFNKNLELMPVEDARAKLESDMKKFTEMIYTLKETYGLHETVLQDLIGHNETGIFNDLISSAPFLNDPEALDRIQSFTDKMKELGSIDSEGLRKLQQELKMTDEEFSALTEKYKELRKWETPDENAHFMDDMLAADKEALLLQNKRNTMLGDEFEAERKLLDLALRRREIMESGLAAPDVLEGMFNAELEALAAQIEKDLNNIQDIQVKMDAQSQASAYTQANRMIIEVKNDGEEVRHKEMMDLLQAIRDVLAGRAVMNVELV